MEGLLRFTEGRADYHTRAACRGSAPCRYGQRSSGAAGVLTATLAYVQPTQVPRWATQTPPAQNPWQSASAEHVLRAHVPCVHSKLVGQSVDAWHAGSHIIVVVLQVWFAGQVAELPAQEATHVLHGPQSMPVAQSALLEHAGVCQ
jgi:hypothetical protein